MLLISVTPGCAVIDGLSGGAPFALAFQIPMGGSADVVAGDFNGDNVADLAITQPISAEIYLFLSDNGSQLEPSYDGAVTQNGFGDKDRLWVADVDGDGDDDLVATSYNASETETNCRLFAAPEGAGGVGAATVEGEIIASAGGGFSPDNSVVFMTSGPDRIVGVVPNFSNTATVTAIHELGDDNATDITGAALHLGDGLRDIAYCHSAGFSVLLADGDTFLAPTTVNTGPVLDLAAVNISGDDVDELALLYPNLSVDWTAEIVKPDGATQGSITISGLTNPARAIHIANIDGIPREDIVILADEVGVQAALGYAAGHFSTYQAIDIGAIPERIIVADFDGDGLDDIAAIGGGAIRVYRNNSY